MSGIRVFHSAREAIREGFTVYDKTRDGYLVRRRQNLQWELAIVDLTGRTQLSELPDSSQLNFGA